MKPMLRAFSARALVLMTVLLGSFAGLVPLAPSAEAAHPYSSCDSETIWKAPCTFQCSAGSWVSMTARAFAGGFVSGHVACGGTARYCDAVAELSCTDGDFAQQDDDAGTCFAVGYGTITCSASGGSPTGRSDKSCSAWVIGTPLLDFICSFSCEPGDEILVAGAGTGVVEVSGCAPYASCTPLSNDCYEEADGQGGWGGGSCWARGWLAVSCAAR